MKTRGRGSRGTWSLGACPFVSTLLPSPLGEELDDVILVFSGVKIYNVCSQARYTSRNRMVSAKL